jgi:hypothetical protein
MKKEDKETISAIVGGIALIGLAMIVMQLALNAM